MSKNWHPEPEARQLRHRRKIIWSHNPERVATVLLWASPARGQGQTPDWQAQVCKYAEAKDWDSALRIVEQEIARAPEDMDVRAWRARVFAWSGKLAEAEQEYLAILKVSRTDPDNWMGLAGVYLREGKIPQAQQAIDAAEELDPKRSDIRAARARVLRAAGERKEAQSEFQSALRLDPGSMEARDGLISVRRGAHHELRFGQDDDLLNYSADFHDEFASVVSQWTPRWTTSAAGDFYQRSGAEAGKFVGSITRRQPKWSALTLGGAIAHDNAVIPKSEAFFDLRSVAPRASWCEIFRRKNVSLQKKKKEGQGLESKKGTFLLSFDIPKMNT